MQVELGKSKSKLDEHLALFRQKSEEIASRIKEFETQNLKDRETLNALYEKSHQLTRQSLNEALSLQETLQKTGTLGKTSDTLSQKQSSLAKQISEIENRIKAREDQILTAADFVRKCGMDLEKEQNAFNAAKYLVENEIKKLFSADPYFADIPDKRLPKALPDKNQAGSNSGGETKGGEWVLADSPTDVNQEILKNKEYKVSISPGDGSGSISFIYKKNGEPPAIRADSFNWKVPKRMKPGDTIELPLALTNQTNNGWYNASLYARLTRFGTPAGITYAEDIDIGRLDACWRDKEGTDYKKVFSVTAPGCPGQTSQALPKIRLQICYNTYQAWGATYYDYEWKTNLPSSDQNPSQNSEPTPGKKPATEAITEEEKKIPQSPPPPSKEEKSSLPIEGEWRNQVPFMEIGGKVLYTENVLKILRKGESLSYSITSTYPDKKVKSKNGTAKINGDTVEIENKVYSLSEKGSVLKAPNGTSYKRT